MRAFYGGLIGVVIGFVAGLLLVAVTRSPPEQETGITAAHPTQVVAVNSAPADAKSPAEAQAWADRRRLDDDSELVEIKMPFHEALRCLEYENSIIRDPIPPTKGIIYCGSLPDVTESPFDSTAHHQHPAFDRASDPGKAAWFYGKTDDKLVSIDVYGWENAVKSFEISCDDSPAAISEAKRIAQYAAWDFLRCPLDRAKLLSAGAMRALDYSLPEIGIAAFGEFNETEMEVRREHHLVAPTEVQPPDTIRILFHCGKHWR